MKLFSNRPVFSTLGDFLAALETSNQLMRISEPVSTVLEVTELHRRVIARHGPALVIEKPIKADGVPSEIPLVTNLFGTVDRVARALGGKGRDDLLNLGRFLAELRQPEPPTGLRDAMRKWPLARAALGSRPAIVTNPPCQVGIRRGSDIDLGRLPVQTCWPGEPAPLITWPIVITRPPGPMTAASHNWGIYRMQVTGPDSAIVRWLAHRGGAKHFREWQARGEPMPIAVAIGADPATLLAAVTPVPETLPEASFAGLLRGERTRLAKAVTVPLLVPAEAEIILEGTIAPDDVALEGPYGDHTGYYNAADTYPVMRLSAITTRQDPLYLSTFTGRVPDEPAVLSEALNDVFLPLLQQQFPEVVDCWLPPEAASYRIAVASIDKRYPGHARRIMLGLWSMLPQFSYTKLVIVVDDDIDARNWSDVMWAVATRSDPSRDLLVLSDMPIDVLDFASPLPGLGGKLGIDATRKIGAETTRDWGERLCMDHAVVERVDDLFGRLETLSRAASDGRAA
ncbi:MAG: 3-octaprenyl-4-hydroxybenzoate carboxy-lyase [Alphaproteobacteria bacterium BRH_c36]|nr:MAG: 3-octaprenyl-4-hydroxybenzoate carboxy-lyase [Alphaproteobacteria bacterium BRH_c36]